MANFGLHGGEYASAGEVESAIAQGQLITAAEAAHLEKLADQVKANKDKFLKFLKVESFAQIPANQYGAAEAALKKKEAAQ